MKVLFAAAEAYPFMKTGGLGDVAYALPKALRTSGIDARVIMPKYTNIPQEYVSRMGKIAEFNVQVGWRNQYCGLFCLEYDGTPFYFIDNEYYFKRGGAYGDYDDGEKFSFFSRAILDAINYLGDFTPDILHCNDWHTAMSIPLLNQYYRSNPKFSNIKTVYTIHNLKYQGIMAKEMLGELLNLDESYFSEDKLKYYDSISYMKGGLNFADIITTVSPTYAEEIKTEYYGEGLHGLLKRRENDLYGIVNGLDMDLYNPRTDESIFEKYDENNIWGKEKNKLGLQKLLNLPERSDVPVIGMVTRLEEQKGIDLIRRVIEDMLQDDIQLIVLGTGNREYEDVFKFFAWKYPQKVSANIYFDNYLARKIYAGSDMFLMPSRFEPCGTCQLIALRYGSIPIVRETGGLNDTVYAYNEFTGEGNGFSFKDYNAHDMLYTIRRAIGFYRNKYVWDNLVRRAMTGDYSWQRSAEQYINLYNKLL